jgi:hypothetical protein
MSNLVPDMRHSAPATATVPTGLRIGLVLMFLFTLLSGLQRQYAPRWFYDSFPGFGMQWVSADGPYNEHLIRDLGGATLAFAVVIGFALWRPSAALVRVVAAAMLVEQIPHFTYHVSHLYLFPTLREQVLLTASLAAIILLPLLVFIGARGIREPACVEAMPQVAAHSGNPLIAR